MLDRGLRERLAADYPRARGIPAFPPGEPDRLDPEQALKQRTGDSFTYEWQHFGDLRGEWEKNFLDYIRPHDATSFRDKLVLDVGAGSGRHSLEAARLGARVVAVDIGRSIDVARRNLPSEILTVQADAERLPFAPGTFDFVMCLGVLHHLPDPERALREIARFASPGGTVHIYVYWVPPYRSHGGLLRVVSALRRFSARLPHRLLHVLCYPLAAVLYVSVVIPYRTLRNRPRTASIARRLPLKTYADYPFGVLVNDQFDRFSAPLEHRYTETEVRDMLERSGLSDVTVLPNAGWLGDGRMPTEAAPKTRRH
jgi:SAM-dependent methyltransferase